MFCFNPIEPKQPFLGFDFLQMEKYPSSPAAVESKHLHFFFTLNAV